MTVYGYLRVSTVKQEETNFKASIIELAQSKGFYSPIVWIAETVSGRKDWRHRLLGQEFEKMKKDDIIIMAEYSRIGRNFLQSMEFLSECRRKGVTVYSTIGDIPVKDDPTSNLLLAVTAWKAQTERENLAYRTKIGLSATKSRGTVLGRPKKMKLDKDLNNIRLIQDELDKGVKLHMICSHFNCTMPTLRKFINKNHLIKSSRLPPETPIII
jgi:putative DNA-invertase from lambdoid prophage Rac